MLDSLKITRRQSEIRQSLAALVGKDAPAAEDLARIEALDLEFRQNETRYRAALIAEDTERREAGAELETRAGTEWRDLVAGYQVQQIARALDEGRPLDGRTAEIVTELRSKGSFRGLPLPWEALETRNTVASGTPDPRVTAPIIDRLFPASAAARMGAQMIAIPQGLVEYPVVTSSVAAGWADGETANVAGPTAFATTDRAMNPNKTLGIQMRISRRALLQSGAALEDAVRRDMNSAVAQAMDAAVFLGTGANGQPLGVVAGTATYGITSTALAAAATWAAFRAAVARFIAANAAGGPGEVRLLLRPEVWSYMDGALLTSTAVSEWDRLTAQIGAGNVTLATNALAAPTGTPLASNAVLTTSAGGVAPIFVGMWGAMDLIRDPFSDAQSGGLRLTGLATMDVTVARPAQIEVLTGVRQA
jgi:HK97 family phage major capsid protein